MAIKSDESVAVREVLWRIHTFGRDHHRPGDRWYLRNERRTPRGAVVLQYVLEGAMAFDDRRGRTWAEADMAAIFTYGEATGYGLPPEATVPCRSMWVILQGAGLVEHVQAFRRLHGGSVLDLRGNRSIAAAMRELMATAAAPGLRDIVRLGAATHGLMMRLFDHAREQRRSTLRPVDRAVDDLLQDPLGNGSLKQVAARHGVSREHLTRCFAQRVGTPPGRYLDEQRRRRAIELLTQTTLPMAQVARQAGYANTHTLARQVRQATGRSPTAVRRSAGALDAQRPNA